MLSSSPGEVPALIEAILGGRIDGSVYEGDCACLVGTLAKARHCPISAIPGLIPDSDRPAEVFFMSIRKGDTPETNPFSKLALEWCEEWLGNVKAAFGYDGPIVTFSSSESLAV